MDSRLNSTIRNFDGHLTAEEVAKKYIVTENFEKGLCLVVLISQIDMEIK